MGFKDNEKFYTQVGGVSLLALFNLCLKSGSAFGKSKWITVSNSNDGEAGVQLNSYKSLVKRKSLCRRYRLKIHYSFLMIRDNVMIPSCESVDAYAFTTMVRWRNRNHSRHGDFTKAPHSSNVWSWDCSDLRVKCFCFWYQVETCSLFFLGKLTIIGRLKNQTVYG